MHKSLGNGVDPADLIAKYGADIVRLWAASADYRLDMRCSDAIFKQLRRSTSRSATPRAISSATSRASTPTRTWCR